METKKQWITPEVTEIEIKAKSLDTDADGLSGS